jgi:chromosome segregation ATPase
MLVEPSDLDQLREALAALAEDLRVANEQLEILESQRVELAGQLQQVRAVVQRMAGEFDRLREM